MKKLNTKSKKKRGEDFEKEIAVLYEAMGYKAKRNQSIHGQEIDILAIRNIPGSSEYKLIVECKYKKGNKKASNEDIQSIAGAFIIAKVINEADACTIVTTNGFSTQAQDAAKAIGITLKTKQELIRELIDFSYYLGNLKKDYNEDFGNGDSSCYIETKGRYICEVIDSLDNFMDNWLTAKSKRPIVLRGSYGVGKTSFCRHYAVHLLANIEINIIPLIIPLKDFARDQKIESLIHNFLQERCNVWSPNFQSFEHMYREGMLLLFFDGLDEMVTSPDVFILEEKLCEIEKFAGTLGNVILTCRPEGFITEQEETNAWYPYKDPISERLAIYTPINLELWNEKQVEQFIKKKIHTLSPQPSESAEYYIERIEKSSILKDMAKRAIHLSLMVKMLPTIIKENIKISRKRLYQEYINQELKKAAFNDKVHPNFSTQERLGLMRAISTEIFLQSRNSIDFEIAKKIVRKELQNANVNIDSLTRSLLNRSFLQRDGDIYHFAYQSIGEYLLALEVDNRLMEGDLNLLENIKLSATLAGMVLEIMGGMEAFPKMLSALELLKNKQLEVEKLSKIEFAALSIEDYIENIFMKWEETPNSEDATLIKGFIRYLIKEIKNNLTPIKIDIFLLRSPKKGKHRKKSVLRLSDQWEKLLTSVELLRKFHQNLLDQNFEFRIRRVNIGLMPFIATIISGLPIGVVEREGGESYCAGDEFVLGLIITLILKHIIDTRKYPPSEDALLKIGISEAKEKISIVFSYRGLIAEQGTEPKTNIEYIREFLKLINGSIFINSDTSLSNFEILFSKG